jgi:type II secretory pathway component PulK
MYHNRISLAQPDIATPGTGRRAFVILVVLVVIVVLSLAAYQYVDLMVQEYHGADNVYRAAQVRALAEAGIQYAAVVLSSPDAFNQTLGGNPYNVDSFQGYVVLDNGQPGGRGMFYIVAPLQFEGMTDTNGGGFRYGVIDESGKINLNTMLKIDPSGEKLNTMLLNLPGMNDSLAAAMVDWVDADDEARSGGAETSSYSGMPTPYSAKNGPLESFDELILVQGILPQVLYGNDTNRNLMIDGNEVSQDPNTDLGLTQYVTLWTREQNITSTNYLRININQKDLNDLQQKLNALSNFDQDLAAYIILYRTYGGSAVSNTTTQTTPQSTTPAKSTTPAPAATTPAKSMTPAPAATTPAKSTTPAAPASSPSSGSKTATPTKTGWAPASGFPVAGRYAFLRLTQLAGMAQLPPARLGSGQSSSSRLLRLASLGQTTSGKTAKSPTSTKGTASSASKGLNLSKGGKNTFSSLLDMVDSQVSIPSSDGKSPPTIVYSPLNDPASVRQFLPVLYDKCTTTSKTDIPARININTAPQAVIAVLPGLSATDVQNIMAARPAPGTTNVDPIFQTPAWLITEAKVSATTVKSLEQYITTASQVYRIQVIGCFEGGGPFCRLEAVIDTNAGRPRILFVRDLTVLGKGFDIPTGN